MIGSSSIETFALFFLDFYISLYLTNLVRIVELSGSRSMVRKFEY